MAARAGLFATSGTLVAGLVLLAAAGVVLIGGEAVALGFTQLVASGLEAAVVHRSSPAAALSALTLDGLMLLVPLLVTIFLVALAAALIPAFVAKRESGRSAVPLPRRWGGRGASLAIRLAGAALFILLAAWVWRSHVGSLVLFAGGDRAAPQELFTALIQLMVAGGASLVVVGLADLSIRRRAIWKALHIDTLEARREARAAGGDPAVKAEVRRRARGKVR